MKPEKQPAPASFSDVAALPPNARHILRAADGYMDLEMWDQAGRELASLDQQSRESFPAAMLRYRLASSRGDWPGAAAVARQIRSNRPDQVDSWVMLAYAERRAVSIESAREILMAAREKFPKEAIVFYNLACYECRLQHNVEAENFLHKAFELDPLFRKTAMGDEDLEPLWPLLKGL